MAQGSPRQTRSHMCDHQTGKDCDQVPVRWQMAQLSGVKRGQKGTYEKTISGDSAERQY